MGRLEDLLENLDRSTMVGLEIGPNFNPVAPKAAGWKTLVIDYSDATALRERAYNHTSEDVRRMASNIEEVDIVWEGQPIDAATREVAPHGFDYVIASHVIEHVPDLLSFLQQCSRALKPGGIMSFAVPDMRKCFDLLKRPTSIADVLAAFREKRIKHSPETLFIAEGWGVKRGERGAWIEGDDARISFTGRLSDAWASYRSRLSNPPQEYQDAHAWYFTPATFQLLMLELGYLGLTDYAPASIKPNIGSEFVVQMRRGVRPIEPVELDRRRLELAIDGVRELNEVLQH